MEKRTAPRLIERDGRPEATASPADSPDERVRRALARELHDGVAQTLTTMLLELEAFRRQQYGRAGVLDEIEALRRSTVQALDTLRALLYNLRSENSVDSTFVDDLRAILADCTTRFGLATGLHASHSWPDRLSSSAAAHLRRIVQEAVHNAEIHAGGTRIDVELDVDEQDQLEITISDDGSGAAPETVMKGGFGLLGMRERAFLIRGRLVVETRPGRGTTVRLAVPLDAVVAT